MIRRLLVLCMSLLCALALSSCGGGDSGDGGKTGAKTVDGIPAYATTNDETGAQNFARYWVDTFNQATTTGDTKKLASLNKKSCTTCADFVKTIDGIYAKGGHVETKGLKVKKIVNEANVPAPGAGVSVVLTASPQKVYPAKDAKPKSYQQTDVRFRLILIRVANHWEMDRIDPA